MLCFGGRFCKIGARRARTGCLKYKLAGSIEHRNIGASPATDAETRPSTVTKRDAKLQGSYAAEHGGQFSKNTLRIA